MSRTISNTVDYFPHFSKHGKTLFILKSRFGNDGYAFWFQLLELLSQTENHFYDCCKEEFWQYLLSYCGSNVITGTEILGMLAKLGNIDAGLWEKRVIWCQALVDNFTDIYKKRGRAKPSKPIIANNNGITDNIILLSAPEMPQSKLKETKGNNNNSKPNETLLLSSDRVDVFDLFEKEIGLLTPLVKEELTTALVALPSEWVADAIGEASRANKRNWRYIAGILENWKRDGREVNTVPQVSPGEKPKEDYGPPDEKAPEIWQTALVELKKKVSGANFRTWFQMTAGHSFRDGVFLIRAPSQSVADYLEKSQRSLIENVLTSATGGEVKVRAFCPGDDGLIGGYSLERALLIARGELEAVPSVVKIMQNDLKRKGVSFEESTLAGCGETP